MKRSEVCEIIKEQITNYFDGIKDEKHYELAECILHKLEDFMIPNTFYYAATGDESSVRELIESFEIDGSFEWEEENETK